MPFVAAAAAIGATIGGFVGGGLFTAAAWTGVQIGLIVGGVLEYFLNRPGEVDGPNASKTYGWNNAGNMASAGDPIPVVYGEIEVKPRLINGWIDVSKDHKKQKLNMLFAVCEGEIDSISHVSVNDTPIDDFIEIRHFEGFTFTNGSNQATFTIAIPTPDDIDKYDDEDIWNDAAIVIDGEAVEYPVKGYSCGAPLSGRLLITVTLDTVYAGVTGTKNFTLYCGDKYSRVGWEYTTGTASQSSIPGFSQVHLTQSVNQTLVELGESTTITTVNSDVTAFRVAISTNLYKVDSDGEVEDVRLWYRYRYRKDDGAGGWEAWSDWQDEDNPFKKEGHGTTWTFVISEGLGTPLTSGQYQIEVERRTKDATEATRKEITMVVDWCDEIRDYNLVYPQTALLAIRALATEKLGGSPPDITALVKGMKVLNLTTMATAWSDNPAECLFDLLIAKRYGMGYDRRWDTGTCEAGGDATHIIDTSLLTRASIYTGRLIRMTSGTYDGESSVIQTVDPDLGKATVSPAFSGAPGAGDTFTIIRDLDVTSFQTTKAYENEFAKAGKKPIEIRYTGAAPAAALTITATASGGATALAVVAGGADNISLDLTNASYNTLNEVVSYIDGLVGYTCTLNIPRYGTSNSNILAAVAAQDIKTANYGCWMTEKRHRVDMVIDFGMDPLDFIRMWTTHFMSFFTYQDGRWRLIPDQVTASTQTFDDTHVYSGGRDNLLQGSFSWRFRPESELPNVIEATFVDRDTEYEDNGIVVYDSGAVADAGYNERKQDVQFTGITRMSQAYRLAVRFLNYSRYAQKQVGFATDLGAMGLEVGDVFTLTQEDTWTSETFRCLGMQLTQDGQMTELVGIEYSSDIYDDDLYQIVADPVQPSLPSPNLIPFNVDQFSAKEDTKQHAAILTFQVPHDNLCGMWIKCGDQTATLTVTVVGGLATTLTTTTYAGGASDLNIDLTAQAYDTLGELVDYINTQNGYDAGLRGPSFADEPSRNLAPQAAEGITYRQWLPLQNRDVDPKVRVWDHAELYVAKSKQSQWVHIGDSPDGYFLFDGVVPGYRYLFKAVSVSKNGVRAVDPPIVALRIKGSNYDQENDVLNVQGFELAGDSGVVGNNGLGNTVTFSGKDCVVQWRNTAGRGGWLSGPPMFRGKIGGGESDFDLKHTVVQILDLNQQIIRIEQVPPTTNQYVYSLGMNMQDNGGRAPRNQFIIRAKHRDINGRTSPYWAHMTVSHSTTHLGKVQNLTLLPGYRCLQLRWDRIWGATEYDVHICGVTASETDFTPLPKVGTPSGRYEGTVDSGTGNNKFIDADYASGNPKNPDGTFTNDYFLGCAVTITLAASSNRTIVRAISAFNATTGEFTVTPAMTSQATAGDAIFFGTYLNTTQSENDVFNGSMSQDWLFKVCARDEFDIASEYSDAASYDQIDDQVVFKKLVQPFEITEFSPGVETWHAPQIGFDPTNNRLVFGLRQQSDGYDLYHAYYDVATQTFSVPTEIVSGIGSESNHAISVESDGTIHWAYIDPGTNRVRYGQTDKDGVITLAFSDVYSAHNYDGVDIALDSSNQVLFIMRDTGTYDLYAALRSAAGAALIGETQIMDASAVGVESSGFQCLAIDGNNYGHILFRERGADSDLYFMSISQVGAALVVQSIPVEILSDGQNHSSNSLIYSSVGVPHLHAFMDGNYGGTGSGDIFRMKLDTNGRVMSYLLPLVFDMRKYYRAPKICLDDSNRLYLVFKEDNADQIWMAVYQESVPATGTGGVEELIDQASV